MINFATRTLLASSALAMTAGIAAAEEVVLGYVPASLEYPYNVATAKGFEEMAKELGAKALIVDPRGSVEKQANAIDDLVLQGVQGIAALTLDGVIGQSWSDKLAEAGIPFVSIATQIGDSKAHAWADVYPSLTALVGVDSVKAGELAAELSATLVPKDHRIKIAIIEGAPGYPQSIQRSVGFKQGLDAAGIQYEIVSSQPTDWTPEAGEAVCQNALTATPDIDLFFSQADDMAIGCRQALDAAGSKALLVATGGGSQLGVAAIEAGEIDGSVCIRPETEGRLAAKALYDAITKDSTSKGQVVTYETPIITKDTLVNCPPEW